ncbi:MAG: LAGLIDADG family homing endonuclease, partial [Chloroflexota bacterium]
MPPFELVSNFRPTGDQPDAISKLVEGIASGQKHQVLLGATGTGKSLGHDDPVFIVEDRNGQRISRVLPIGRLADQLLEQPAANIRHEGDTEILDIESGSVRYYAQAFDPRDCSITLRPVRSVIRHHAPARMYRLQTACGRSATLTGDHNLWVLRNGQLLLIKTDEALPTDYVPLPEFMLAEGNKETLDTLTALSAKRLFVEAPEAMRAYLEAYGPNRLAHALVENGVHAPYSKLSAIRHQIHGRGIEIKAFQHVLESTEALGGHWDGAQATVGGKLRHNRLPAWLRLTPDFLRLLGYYIAEGNHQDRYLIIANRDELVRQDIYAALAQLGIPYGVRKSSDVQISSAALAELFGRLCGEKAHTKQLPEFWPELPARNLGQLLRAYFDGDGTVGKASDVTATTASPQLASDLLYALLRFGIWARLSRRWKRATNSRHAGDWYHYITISGQDNLRRFQQQIGFSIAHKAQALEDQSHRSSNSNVDIAPIQGSQLRWLRTQLGLAAQELGDRSGVSRSAIQMWETGKRAPGRDHLRAALTALREEAICCIRNNGDWRSVWQYLYNLCLLRWTPIESVESIACSDPHVYDLCVPGAETFLAGVGGFFVHNTFTIANIVAQTQRPA